MATHNTFRLSLVRTCVAPGEAVVGAVFLSLVRPQKARGVVVKVEGELRTRVTYSTGSGKQRHTHTVTHEENLLSGLTPTTVLDPLVSFGQPEIPPGTYTFPFEFVLPDRVLPSWSSGDSSGCISYMCSAKVDVPWGFDMTAQTPFAVLPRTRTGPAENETMTMTDKKEFVFGGPNPMTLEVQVRSCLSAHRNLLLRRC